jgi:hypothetical protein
VTTMTCSAHLASADEKKIRNDRKCINFTDAPAVVLSFSGQ